MIISMNVHEAMTISDTLFKICRKAACDCSKCQLHRDDGDCVFSRVISATVDEINGTKDKKKVAPVLTHRSDK